MIKKINSIIYLTAIAVFSLTTSSASALTFKSDGSVVQKSGKVVAESFAVRYGKQFLPNAENWPKATGTGTFPDGYLGDDILVVGTPLLVIKKIKQGDSYVEALMEQNGFADKQALQRFIVANATPEFIEKLGITEDQAMSFVGSVDPDFMSSLNPEYANQFAALSGSVGEKIKGVIDDAVETAVEEAVSEAVEEALDDAFDDWWGDFIQELIDSGATIIELTDDYVVYQE